MAGVLGQCPAHGVVAINGIVGGGGVRITLINSVGSCPHCGRTIPLLDGTFQFFDDLVQVLSAPTLTMRALRESAEAIKQASRRVNHASSGDEVTEAVSALVSEVAKTNEALADVIAEGTRQETKARVKWFLGVLFTILMWLYTPEDVGASATEAVDWASESVEAVVKAVIAQNPPED